MLKPAFKKNDFKARILIGVFSIVVFSIIVLLGQYHLVDVKLGFNAHIFAAISAVVNSIVSILLIVGLLTVKKKKYLLHKRVMLLAMVLSIVFLVTYIAHHLLCGDTKFGGDGSIRIVYYILLSTHIFLAAIILPFILFTSYRALTGEYDKHKKLARITWPIWLFVSVTGPIIYLMISPYYK